MLQSTKTGTKISQSRVAEMMTNTKHVHPYTLFYKDSMKKYMKQLLLSIEVREIIYEQE